MGVGERFCTLSCGREEEASKIRMVPPMAPSLRVSAVQVDYLALLAGSSRCFPMSPRTNALGLHNFSLRGKRQRLPCHAGECHALVHGEVQVPSDQSARILVQDQRLSRASQRLLKYVVIHAHSRSHTANVSSFQERYGSRCVGLRVRVHCPVVLSVQRRDRFGLTRPTPIADLRGTVNRKHDPLLSPSFAAIVLDRRRRRA